MQTFTKKKTFTLCNVSNYEMLHPMKQRNRLRVWRAERRMTQIKLATRADINMTRYWRIENGYIDPTETEKTKLARILKAPDVDSVFPQAEAVAS